MSVETLEQKIAKQEERLRQLKAQKQAIAAREKKKNSDRQIKDDTRRKILLGSYLLKTLLLGVDEGLQTVGENIHLHL